MTSIAKLVRLHKSLMKLSHSAGFIDYPRVSKLKRMARACAQHLNVSRVSIWKMNAEQEKIVCEVLYILDEDHFYKGAELNKEDYPSYFSALSEDRIINADNAILDPRTSEFTESYLIPNDIASMLGAPIYSDGRLQGVICLEQVGIARIWDMAELSYLISVADSISVVNEHEAWVDGREQLALLEENDLLTQLETRSTFQKRLLFDLEDSPDPERTRVLLLLNLDFFASINDKHGHRKADSLLIAVARCLECIAKPYNCRLARVGGDTFALWLPNLKSKEKLEELTCQLNKMSETPIRVDDSELRVSFSSGVVIYPTSTDIDDPMQCAELALQRSKDLSRGGVEYFSLEWLKQLQHKHSLESELRQAFELNQLEAHYQPVLSAETGRVLGLEALVRWQHPKRGMLLPAEFLPLTKKLGLMGRLDRYMLRYALSDLSDLRSMGSPVLWVSVNLSSEQFYSPSLGEDIAEILDECDLLASSLELEIVEELVRQKSALVSAQLGTLSELGVKLSIDDFGIGDTSLSRLQHMPIAKLKIDRSIITDLPYSEEACCISQSIIGLVQGLGKGKKRGDEVQLVAKGVESKSQAEYLKVSGCTYVQGFYYAKALPMSELKSHRLITSSMTSKPI